jgi:hypothetical protein
MLARAITNEKKMMMVLWDLCLSKKQKNANFIESFWLEINHLFKNTS